MPRGRPKGSKNKPKDTGGSVITALGEIQTIENTEVAPYKRGRGRPKGLKGNGPVKHPVTAEERDFNARLIQHIMQINEIRSHADRNDLMSLKSCFIAYLKLCQQNGFSVTNLSAYAAMGFDNFSFNNFANRCATDPERAEFVRLVKETCSMFRESMVSANKLNPVIGIFWQRNYDGLRNDTEQIQAAIEQEEDYQNGSKAYKEKYRNLIGE